MKRKLYLLTILFFFISASLAHADSLLFEPYISFHVGSSPEAVAIGDVNNDGRDDVVLTTSYYFDSSNDYHLFVFLQNADGSLSQPIKYPTSGTYVAPPRTVAIGDINNDRLLDVVVGAGGHIEVFLQNTSGSLNTSLKYPTNDSYKIRIGDFNNDGLSDVVGIGWGTNTATVFLQNLHGRLNLPITYTVSHGGLFAL